MNARSLAFIATATLLSGCVSMPDRIDMGWSHDSHPMQGWPFGPSEEEDSLDKLGLRAAWHRDRYLMEMGVSRKIGEGGFYGDDVIFTSYVGMRLWGKK